jgi:hypothetical protein
MVVKARQSRYPSFQDEINRIIKGEPNMQEEISRDEFTKLEKRMVALETYVFTGKAKVKK